MPPPPLSPIKGPTPPNPIFPPPSHFLPRLVVPSVSPVAPSSVFESFNLGAGYVIGQAYLHVINLDGTLDNEPQPDPTTPTNSIVTAINVVSGSHTSRVIASVRRPSSQTCSSKNIHAVLEYTAGYSVPILGNGHLPTTASTGLPDNSFASASDSEAEGDAANYLPISGTASDPETDSDGDADPDPDLASCRCLDAIDNGVSELDLASDDEEEEESGEEATVAASLDDERRRRAQFSLPAGVAARIMDAMRDVAFPGAPPPWVGSVPDEQWA
ncbi:hypothetical protein ZWY2020_034588 [Hordeum vulgare]|nr:hypothetical protein ZWY2020_034588 [Hordeum vulgare]